MIARVKYSKGSTIITSKLESNPYVVYTKPLIRYSIETEDKDKNILWSNDFLEMSSILGKRSHCVSHGVAAFITKDNRIISTGINGTPAGLKNCDDIFWNYNPDCEDDRNTHHEFSLKYEIHAEVNALLSAARTGIAVDNSTIYVNYSPCRDCAKVILASGIKSLYFKDFYMNDLNGFILLLCSNIVSVNQIINDDTGIKEIEEKVKSKVDVVNEVLADTMLKSTPFIDF